MVKQLMRVSGVLLTMLLAGSAMADEDRLQLRPGMMGIADIGAQNCALFSDMHYNGPAGMEHHILTWVQGYVHAQTGSNIDAMLARMPDDHGWNFDRLSGHIVSYCADNPEAPVAEAAISLWRVLQEQQSAP